MTRSDHYIKHARWMVQSGQFRGTVEEYLSFLRYGSAEEQAETLARWREIEEAEGSNDE